MRMRAKVQCLKGYGCQHACPLQQDENKTRLGNASSCSRNARRQRYARGTFKDSTYRSISQREVQVLAIAGTLNEVLNDIIAKGKEKGLGGEVVVPFRGAVEE